MSTALERFAINMTIGDPDFTVRELAVMALLKEHANDPTARRVSTIAATLQTNRPAITRIGQRFAEEGLVTQSMLDTDARACVLTLTKKGKERLECINRGWQPKA